MFDIDGAGTTSYFPTAGYLEANKHMTMYLEYRGYLWTNAGGATAENRYYLQQRKPELKHDPPCEGISDPLYESRTTKNR
ncbi:MAG: hypothetical protein V8Q54_02165 [Alistipes senegalensis]